MTLRAIYRFELAYQLRRGWPWVIGGALFGISFLLTRDAMLAEALREDFFVNSPFAVAKTTVVAGLFWLLVAAAIAGEAAARDRATGMHPLAWTTPVGETEYLGGRFLAALTLNALLLFVIQVAIVVGVYAPGVDPSTIGPFRPAAHLTAFAYLSLPNAFVATALQFWLATRSGRPMAAYLGSLLLFFMGFFVASMLLFNRDWGALLDPIGMRYVLSEMSHQWTTVEKSHRLLALDGGVGLNRLIWFGVGLGALAITVARFRFAHPEEGGGRRWWRRGRAGVVEGSGDAGDAASAGSSTIGGYAAATPEGIGNRTGRRQPPAIGSIAADGLATPVPHATRSIGLGIDLRRALAIGWASFRAIAWSRAGLALLVAIPLLTVVVVLDQMSALGVPLVPTTALVLVQLTAPLSAELSRWVIVPLAIVFFAGELVWREREAGLDEITDAMPGSEWHPLLGKLLGLALLLAAFLALLGAAGVIAQSLLGHRDYEIGLYLTALFGLQLPEYLLFAALALAVHVVVDHKYVGHLLAILAYVFLAVSTLFGVEHDLLVYGAGPDWSYTEMRGFGASLGPWASFKLYWAAWALLLAVLARLFWVRGRESGMAVRWAEARRRLTGPTARAGVVAAVLVVALGGFAFYNTNVRNEYVDSDRAAERAAEYERRYGRYARASQPHLAATRLRVEIRPERRAAEIEGTYRLVNRDAAPIDSVHVALSADVETGEIGFDRPVSLAVDDAEQGHRIYALAEPLAPGDSVAMTFRVVMEPRGFGERGIDPSIAANGTFFTNARLPAIGYQPSRELTSNTQRREHGLEARPLVPSLYDPEAREGRSGGTWFEAVVRTSEGQTAVAPGALVETWTEGGRSHFRYVTDAPIGGEWAFFSAAYAVREARWLDPDGSGRAVDVRIHHHPEHTGQLDRIERSIMASLDYFTRHFGPYPYGHLTLAESPGNGTGMHAEPSMVWFSEGSALWGRADDAARLDLPYAVVAHEMGHQWAIPSAYVEGAPVMSESVAWYSAMRVVEETDPAQLRMLLSFMRGPYPYPPIHRGEPLLRGLDPWMGYRKGPYALHALREYVGEEPVNAALRKLIETHRTDGVPLATTLDLVRELRAVTPDSLQYLVHDLFEVNAAWRLEVERVTGVPTGSGAWEVTLEVHARKVVVDSAGVETEVPLDEWIEIGVFGRPDVPRDELGRPLYLERHRIRSGIQTVTVTVEEEPILAGVDPFHVLDWEERGDDDNVEGVGRR